MVYDTSVFWQLFCQIILPIEECCCCRLERWNVCDDMLNQAKKAHVQMAGVDRGKRETLKKSNLPQLIVSFCNSEAPDVEVAAPVALVNMIRWGGYKPCCLFCYTNVSVMDIYLWGMCVSVPLTAWSLSGTSTATTPESHAFCASGKS